MTDATSYAVGYCKPPVHTRFKKGQSGNPSGRPGTKRAIEKNLAQLLEAILDMPPDDPASIKTYTIGGAAMKALVLGMLKGNVAASRLLFARLDEGYSRAKRRHRRSFAELELEERLIAEHEARFPQQGHSQRIISSS
ncbi:MAG TPA: DUF5681 domain-containing protein [Rhizomicrobium sp.]|jgi:hypothetical protein